MQRVAIQQYNTHIISEKLIIIYITFRPHNRFSDLTTDFVSDEVAVVTVVKSTSIRSCGFTVVRFYAALRSFTKSIFITICL